MRVRAGGVGRGVHTTAEAGSSKKGSPSRFAWWSRSSTHAVPGYPASYEVGGYSAAEFRARRGPARRQKNQSRISYLHQQVRFTANRKNCRLQTFMSLIQSLLMVHLSSGEVLVSSYRNTNKIPNAISLRFFNIYGKRQNPEYAGVITKFAERLSQGVSHYLW